MPLGDNIPFTVGSSIGPLHLIKEFPCHEMRGVSPSRNEVAVLVARELQGARMGEELFGGVEKASVLLVPGVLCPVRVGAGGVLSVMLEGELDINTEPFREVHDLLEATNDLHIQPAGFHPLAHDPVRVLTVPMAQPYPRPVHARL
ncbi:MAG: hypothetical protein C4335_03180 [Armatimonadota bacterium]